MRIKIIIYLVVAIAAAIFLLFGWAKLKSYLETKSTRTLPVEKSDLSYPLSSYDQLAELSYNALLESSTEDDSAMLDIIHTLHTPSDFNQLVKSFGVRSDNAFTKSFSGTLPQAMLEFMDNSDYQSAKDHLKAMNVII